MPTPPTPPSTRLPAVLALVVTTVLAACVGCGSSSPRGDGIGEPVVPESAAAQEDLPPVPASTQDLRAAVRLYGDALLTGRAALAYALFTDACRDRVSRVDVTALVERAGDAYGEPLPFASYRADVGGEEVGDTAEVDYSFAGADGLVQVDERWERTADGWRLADC